MPKFTGLRSFFENKPEIVAWLILALAVAGWLKGLGDTQAVALVFLAVALQGYVHQLEAGPFKIGGESWRKLLRSQKRDKEPDK